jgi:hypothetical protein
VIHWRGGSHSEVRIQKPRSGEHTKRASPEADAIIRDMATRFSDDDVATTLNRMGLLTGQAMTWTGARIASFRATAGIRAYASADKGGRCLTMLEAARKIGVSCHMIRKAIKSGVLPARQVVFDAPWQILADDLDRPEVRAALSSPTGRGRPCRNSADTRTLVIPGT